jgi:hypothetical protein
MRSQADVLGIGLARVVLPHLSTHEPPLAVLEALAKLSAAVIAGARADGLAEALEYFLVALLAELADKRAL